MLHLLKKKPSRKNKFTPAIFSQQAFDPLNSPNTVALWDGDMDLQLDRTWGSQVDPLDIIDFQASTTLPLTGGALNGHNTVIFNGTDQYGQCLTFALTQPFGMYIVLNPITAAINKRIIDGSDNSIGLRQSNMANNINLNAGINLASDPDIALGAFGILTCMFNTTNSQIRTNLSPSVVGNIGTNNASGMNVATSSLITAFGNIEIAYMIFRNVIDNTTIQNNFINWLKNRFAI